MIDLVLVFTAVTLAVHYYFKVQDELNYWKNRNVPSARALPFVGNMLQNLLFRKSYSEIVQNIYNEFQGYPMAGFFKLSTPCLVARDPDLIKAVLVKDFSSFRDNEITVDKKTDPLLGRNPFVLKGTEWKTSRSQITPQFTIGKMKAVFPLVDSISSEMVNFAAKHHKSQPCELKELCSKFTISNVASCAFGIDAQCFQDSKSEFRQLADAFVSPESIQGIKIALSLILPHITQFLHIKLIPQHVEEKMRQIIRDTMNYRKSNNVVRSDFIQAIYDNLYKPNDDVVFDDIVGHATSFLFDGYETSANVMSFVLFELACNPDIQDKLRNEIENVLDEHNGRFTYESLSKMTYLNACVDESLRLHPPLGQLTKICNETFKYRPSNLDDFKDVEVTIEKGTPVIIPLYGLHFDEKYFSEPNEYRPERFFDEEIPKYVYMPFGEGPRICFGQPFGLLQVRVGVAQIIRNFRLSLNKKTRIPLKMDPWFILQAPIGGLWVDFQKI